MVCPFTRQLWLQHLGDQCRVLQRMFSAIWSHPCFLNCFHSLFLAKITQTRNVQAIQFGFKKREMRSKTELLPAMLFVLAAVSPMVSVIRHAHSKRIGLPWMLLAYIFFLARFSLVRHVCLWPLSPPHTHTGKFKFNECRFLPFSSLLSRCLFFDKLISLVSFCQTKLPVVWSIPSFFHQNYNSIKVDIITKTWTN